MSTIFIPILNGEATIFGVTPNELINWRFGRELPSIIDDFERWWIAELIYRRVILDFYSVEGMTVDSEMMSLQTIKWESEVGSCPMAVYYQQDDKPIEFKVRPSLGVR